MKRFLFLGGFLLGAALISQVALTAGDHRDRRYYDRYGRDYHVYNNQEDRAYRIYLGERHQDYREFRRMKRNNQQQYFRWRHDHPDHLIFKLQIR